MSSEIDRNPAIIFTPNCFAAVQKFHFAECSRKIINFYLSIPLVLDVNFVLYLFSFLSAREYHGEKKDMKNRESYGMVWYDMAGIAGWLDGKTRYGV